MASRRRSSFRPTMDYLDRRAVPSTLVYDSVPFVSCDTGTSATTTTTTTTDTSTLLVCGPTAPV